MAARALSHFLAGDPIRRFITRSFMRNLRARARAATMSRCYDMNHTTPEKRTAFLARLEQTFTKW